MYKAIPGTIHYRADIHGNVVDIYGNSVSLPLNKFKAVEITLFGKTRFLLKKELGALAWFESGKIHNLRDHFSKLSYATIRSKVLRSTTGLLQWFKEPIEHIPGFRVIPSYSRYAVTYDGVVLDTENNSIVDKRDIDTSGYTVVYIYCPSKCANRWVRLHRLVALAWIKNDDFSARPYVNHIDGNKENYHGSNLEWCNMSENSQHAYNTGLNVCNEPVKVRDVRTGEIVQYLSLQRACLALGLSTGLSTKSLAFKLPGHLFKGRYEVKLTGDNSPWYYDRLLEEEQLSPGKAYFKITVFDKNTGKNQVFGNLKSFIYNFKVRLVTDNIEVAVATVQQKYPQLEISYQRLALRGPYYGINVKNKSEMVVAKSLKELSSLIDVGINMLQIDLTRKLKFIYNDTWVVVTDLKDLDLSLFVPKPPAVKKIEAVNTATGEVFIYSSINDCIRVLNCQPKTISDKIKNGGNYKGFVFRALDQ